MYAASLFGLWLKLPLILYVKSTNKALFYLHEDINFIFGTYLFDLGLVLKILFSFVIYIYVIFKCCYLAEAFYPKWLTNEVNRSNQKQ